MIVWSGMGILAPIGAFALLVLAEVLTESHFNNEQYYQQHGWPALVAFIVAGLMCFILGKLLKKEKPSGYVDPETGEELMVNPRHSFFWIPLQFWGILFPIIGLVFMFSK